MRGRNIFGTVGHTNSDVGESDEEFGIRGAVNDCICLDNVSEVSFDKVVERVGVLLDESFDFQKCWEKIPFVSGSIDRICQAFAVVEGFEKGINVLDLIAMSRAFRS